MKTVDINNGDTSRCDNSKNMSVDRPEVSGVENSPRRLRKTTKRRLDEMNSDAIADNPRQPSHQSIHDDIEEAALTGNPHKIKQSIRNLTTRDGYSDSEVHAAICEYADKGCSLCQYLIWSVPEYSEEDSDLGAFYLDLSASNGFKPAVCDLLVDSMRLADDIGEMGSLLNDLEGHGVADDRAMSMAKMASLILRWCHQRISLIPDNKDAA